MKTLFILRGLPGAGKSTLARTLENLSTKSVSISLDDYIESKFQPEHMKAYAEACLIRCKEAMQKKCPVIIYHNVNAQGWQWRPYQDLAKHFGYECVVLIVENCHGGKSTKDIPQSKLDDLKSKFKIHL